MFPLAAEIETALFRGGCEYVQLTDERLGELSAYERARLPLFLQTLGIANEYSPVDRSIFFFVDKAGMDRARRQAETRRRLVEEYERAPKPPSPPPFSVPLGELRFNRDAFSLVWPPAGETVNQVTFTTAIEPREPGQPGLSVGPGFDALLREATERMARDIEMQILMGGPLPAAAAPPSPPRAPEPEPQPDVIPPRYTRKIRLK